MTFTEAAVEVLRLAGKPLHYKKITEIAIERDMLAHVGKTPEVTMSSRLATLVKRDRGDAPIVKVKPGVFGLRDFSSAQLADLSGDIDELPEADVQDEQNKAAGEPEAGEVTPSEQAISTPPSERRPLPGADVFPEEADDDEPILGAADDEDDDEEDETAEAGDEERSEGAEGDARSSRRRRRKRRRGRGEGAEAAEPAPAAARGETEERPEQKAREREPRERGERESREREPREREPRERGEREPRDRERDRERGDRDRERVRAADRGRDDFRRERREEPDFSREPGDGDLLGKDLADAVASVLAGAGPRGYPPLRVAEQLVRRGRLNGEPQTLVPTVMAAVRADVARRGVEGTGRARFRSDNGSLLLSDFLLPQDVTRAEQDVMRAAERQRERARRAFLRRVSELPTASLAELLATWLNAEGVVSLRAVRRPGAQGSDLHFAGTLRRGVEEVRVAIIFARDGRELGRERVIEARGATYYYGNAQSVWLITLGQVMSGAKEEAVAPAAVPVALLDGLALAAAMERVGVGMRTQMVAISSIDLDLFDALRGRDRERPERERPERERADRDADRDRGRGRDRGRDADRDRDRDRDADRRERGPREEREPARLPAHPSRQVGADEELEESALEGETQVDAATPAANEVPPPPSAPRETGGFSRDSQVRPLDPRAEAEGEGKEGRRRRRRRRRGRDRLAPEGQEAAAGAAVGEAAEDALDGADAEGREPAEASGDADWDEAGAAGQEPAKSDRERHYQPDPSLPPPRDDDERGLYAERAPWEDDDEVEPPETLDDDPDEVDDEYRPPARRYEDERSDDED